VPAPAPIPAPPKITAADIEAAKAAARDEAMAAVFKKAGVKDEATLAELVKERNDLLREKMSEAEKIKADLAAAVAAKEAAEATVAEERRQREVAEKAHRMETAENAIRTAFVNKGVQPSQMDVAMYLYQQHVRASATVLEPDKFADEVLRKERVYLFTHAAAPVSTSPPNPAPSPAPPAAPPVVETVDNMDQQTFNKHVRDKYGFNPSMS